MSNSRAEDPTSAACQMHGLGLEALLRQAAWLQRCARGMGYRAEAAEDAVQETLLLASQSGSRGLGLGWLRRTLQRRLGMALRAEQSRARRESEAALPEALELDPSRAMERLEAQRAVSKAVAELKREDREVLALRFAADLSVQEIAASLGVTPNAVSSRLSRALKRLRSTLGPDGHPRDRRGYFAWLPFPVGGLFSRSQPGTGSAPSLLSTLLGASLAIAMKKTLIVAAALAFVVLGSVLWTYDTAGEVPMEGPGTSGLAGGPGSVDGLGRGTAPAMMAPSKDEARVAFGPAREDEDALPAEAPPEQGTGSVRVVCEEVGSNKPVGGMPIEVLTVNQGASLPPAARAARTNADGEVCFEGLDPGSIRVILTCFAAAKGSTVETVDVEVGQTSEVRFEVNRIPEVWGTVVDELGQPVADAELWVGHRPGPVENGYRVGRSDAEGQFRLNYVGPNQVVCARSKGHAPSNCNSVAFAQDYESQGIRLVVGERRGTVTGIVRWPTGEVAPGIDVIAGVRTVAAPGPGYYWTPIPQWVKTNAEGAFEFGDLGVGSTSIRALAPGAARWSGTVRVTDGGRTELNIELGLGGSLRGLVRDATGTPAAGARIAAYAAGGDPAAYEIEARCDGEGRFHLTGVRAGEMVLEAKSRDGRARVRETMFIDEGSERAWNPVLSTAHVIAGSVVSESGELLSGWYVAARPIVNGEAARNSAGAHVLGDGTFSIEQAEGELFALDVYPPGRYFGPSALSLESFQPKGDAAAFVVPEDQVPSASVRGRIVSADGGALRARVRLEFATSPKTTVEGSTKAGGEFAFDFLPESSFTLSVEARGCNGLEVPSAGSLARDEERDLGSLSLEER